MVARNEEGEGSDGSLFCLDVHLMHATPHYTAPPRTILVHAMVRVTRITLEESKENYLLPISTQILS